MIAQLCFSNSWAKTNNRPEHAHIHQNGIAREAFASDVLPVEHPQIIFQLSYLTTLINDISNSVEEVWIDGKWIYMYFYGAMNWCLKPESKDLDIY